MCAAFGTNLRDAPGAVFVRSGPLAVVVREGPLARGKYSEIA
jgi:hypothetical protein